MGLQRCFPAQRLLLVVALLLVMRVADGITPQAMGFHEGARRTVRCDGGYITGFDIYFGPSMGFAEATIIALRTKCSSGKINLEYQGSTSDEYVFGNLEPNGFIMRTVDCPKGQGVASVEWRRASSSEKDHTARVGGLRLHCSTEVSTNPLPVDTNGQMTDYPGALRCSETPNPPKGERVRSTGVEVWFDQQFAGMHLLECEVEQ